VARLIASYKRVRGAIVVSMCAEIGKGRSAVKAIVTETTPASTVSSADAVVESFISFELVPESQKNMHKMLL
jgi:hypothetical protein